MVIDGNVLKGSFLMEIKNEYPNIKNVRIEKLKSTGIMNKMFLLQNNKEKYVVKVYEGNLKKIKSEHAVLALVSKEIPSSISFIKNKRNTTYTKSDVFKLYFGIYKYKEGHLMPTSSYFAELAGSFLGRIHRLPQKDVKNNKVILPIKMEDEFNGNISSLNKVLKLLKNKKILTKKERVVKDVVLKKLELLHNYDAGRDLLAIFGSSRGVIHGDFAPANILIDNNGISGVLDWENACEYHHIWELFRSVCHFAKIGSSGLICSKLNPKIIEAFMKGYLRKNKLSLKDVNALRLMPKYYYYLDPYIIVSCVLEKNKKAEKLISDIIGNHFWLENNIKLFDKIITKYA